MADRASDDARQGSSGDGAPADSASLGADASAAGPPTADPAASGALAMAASAAAPGASTSTATVTAQTVTRLANDLVQNVKAKTSRFQLALEPAGLGRVDISVRIGPDGALSATLNFNSPQAADALKAHAGELRDALQQAGFSLGGSDLSFTAGGSNQQSGQGQGRTFTGSSVAAAPEIPAQPAPAIQTASAPADGLDIRI